MDIVVDAEKKFTGIRSVLIYFYFAHVVEWWARRFRSLVAPRLIPRPRARL